MIREILILIFIVIGTGQSIQDPITAGEYYCWLQTNHKIHDKCFNKDQFPLGWDYHKNGSQETKLADRVRNYL